MMNIEGDTFWTLCEDDSSNFFKFYILKHNLLLFFGFKFTKCTRVLRKFDSCPAEKPVTNISTMQNSSTVSRHCNTREPSWAEDFIDLTEFCQPSTIPIKMEDSMDERLTSPINNSTGYYDFFFSVVRFPTCI